jgi:deoxyribonuclease-4
MSITPLIGAHVSTAGGLKNSITNGTNITANAIQIFGASPRQWKASLPTEESLQEFHNARTQNPQIEKIFLHASYLPNLATPNTELYKKSIENLAIHLQIAELLEAEGLVYHIGSYKDSTYEEAIKRVAEGMHQVLKKSPGKAKLIMENSAGGGQKMGLTNKEIGDIYKLNPDLRIKVCIDTAHAFAAGALNTYSPTELEEFKKEAKESYGLENIIVLHINDSKVPHDSRKDRHENIGHGEIGLPAFQHLANDPFFKTIPWILEVPGFEGKGPDKKNVETVRGLF